VLLRLNTEITECYRRARESRARAEQASEPEFKAAFLDMEDRWLALARSYELSESLSTFTRDFSRQRRKR
jgi:hypothetical protein